MNKEQAIEFLKAQGMDISKRTLERATTDKRINSQKVKGRTGPQNDYSEGDLLAFKEAEEAEMGVVIDSPIEATPAAPKPRAAAKPSQAEPTPAKPSAGSLARLPFLGSQEIERAQPSPSQAKPKTARELPAAPSIAEKVLWTVEEAVLATGASKGSIHTAVKAGTLKGGMNGGKIKVVASAARKWAEELF